MKVSVLFFGLARDLTGLAQEDADLPEGESLAGLWRRYQLRFPDLGQMTESMLLSVNQSVEGPARILHNGDEVAFLPPVSGGASEDFYEITREAIVTSAIAGRLKAPEDGALVVFEGIVRNHSHGRATAYLEYEAYEPMANRTLREIGEEAKRKFSIDRLAVVHRVGRIGIGETSVAVIVASAHRAAAFEACRYAIDELKRRAPIWQKEFRQDGSAWAEGEPLAGASVEAIE
ncbi:MAG: molybdenum cofactor biosynthesis protein MoaE [Terriglobia bacterium]